MFFLATKIIDTLVLPPLNLLILSGIGLLVLKTRPRLGRSLIVISWLLLYALSTPLVVRPLRQLLETAPPLQPAEALPDADAIVVLAGGVYIEAPEYGDDTVNGYVLERLRYAARLYRLTGKPILVTGGSTHANTLPESHVMKESLIQDFHVPVQWVEDQSQNTLENARFSAAILQEQGIRRVYLVTHALHMPRARAAFAQAGLDVIPAPTLFATRPGRPLLTLLPNSSTLALSSIILHEWIGRVWYLFR
jgi:uncharacterized SAM-binding protein YcdF (DUF218 family)